MIKSLMSIGSCCDGAIFAKNLGIRVKGPVDNLYAGEIDTTLKLFDRTFEKAAKNRDLVDVGYTKYANFPAAGIGGFNMVHNDIRDLSIYTELVKRIDTFNKYLEEAKTNKDLYFIYTTGELDTKKTVVELSDIKRALPEQVQNRIIVLDTRAHNVNFNIVFPTISQLSIDTFYSEINESLAKKVFDEFIYSDPRLF